MAITDLVPWKRTSRGLALRRPEIDPFSQLHREIDRVFSSFVGDWAGPMNLLDRRMGRFMPEVDVTETDKEIRVTADLPGIEEKDLDLSFTDGLLTIKGEKREEQEEEKSGYCHYERQYGVFELLSPGSSSFRAG